MKKCLLSSFAAAAAFVACASAQAASIYVTPASSTVDLDAGTASFELMMSFSAAEATLGGGIDIDVEGVVSFLSFTPSSFFASAGDPKLSGYGTLHADKDFEVHIVNFGGLSTATNGQESLGKITVSLNSVGSGTLSLASNVFWGGFFTAAGNPQTVTFSPASVTVVAIPEPANAALLLAGVAALALRLQRQRAAA